LIKLIIRENPDLVLTLESDKEWEKELKPIEEEYPYTIKIPQDNLYGMHLYSKLELEDIDIKYLISEEIPSVHGKVKLRTGEKINIHCLHPKPPSPSEDDTSTNRDAELLLVGKEIDGKNSTLVFGDLNDVAWSRTTKLFLRLSGLLDPRIGRGFFNTFHAQYPIFRWPLDHVFHSSDFQLLKLKRLEDIGSDHFPIFIKLVYQPLQKDQNGKTEEPEEEEEEWAEEKIERGKES
jgi:endonuclease/exonuclease/phosphatase (EEP) superfamily protein YafD